MWVVLPVGASKVWNTIFLGHVFQRFTLLKTHFMFGNEKGNIKFGDDHISYPVLINMLTRLDL